MSNAEAKSVYSDINELMWQQMGMQFLKYFPKGP